MTDATDLIVEIDATQPLPDWLPSTFRALLDAAAQWEPSMPAGQWGLTLRVSDDQDIGGLHERFFGDPSPTDVISFPSGDDLGSTGGYLGDIVVSVDTARLNAKEQGHSLERELAFLSLHGLLHLCGQSDSTPVLRAAMLARQTEFLERFERQYGQLW